MSKKTMCLAHCIHYRERAHTAHRTHAHSSSFQPEFVVYFSTPNQLHLFCIPIVDLKCSMCTVHTHVTLKAISSSSYLSVCPGRLWTQRTPAIYSHDKNFDTMHCHGSSIPEPCVCAFVPGIQWQHRYAFSATLRLLPVTAMYGYNRIC